MKYFPQKKKLKKIRISPFDVEINPIFTFTNVLKLQRKRNSEITLTFRPIQGLGIKKCPGRYFDEVSVF